MNRMLEKVGNRQGSVKRNAWNLSRLVRNVKSSSALTTSLERSWPWQVVKEAREKKLKYLRELGVCEKVDERTAVAKYNVPPVNTKWLDTDKAFEEEPMQIRSRIVAREFKSGDSQTCMRGFTTGSFESYRIHCCESQSRVLTDACRCFPYIPPCQGSEARAGETASTRLLRKGGWNTCVEVTTYESGRRWVVVTVPVCFLSVTLVRWPSLICPLALDISFQHVGEIAKMRQLDGRCSSMRRRLPLGTAVAMKLQLRVSQFVSVRREQGISARSCFANYGDSGSPETAVSSHID